MHFSLLPLTLFLSGSLAAIDPATITDLGQLSPAQASAAEAAGSSILASEMNDPALTSIAAELLTWTNTAAIDALTSMMVDGLPTDTAALMSLYSQLPPDVQSYFQSVSRAEVSALSTAINGATGSGSGAAPTTTGAAPSSDTFTLGSASKTASGAAETGTETDSGAAETSTESESMTTEMPTTMATTRKTTSIQQTAFSTGPPASQSAGVGSNAEVVGSGLLAAAMCAIIAVL